MTFNATRPARERTSFGLRTKVTRVPYADEQPLPAAVRDAAVLTVCAHATDAHQLLQALGLEEYR